VLNHFVSKVIQFHLCEILVRGYFKKTLDLENIGIWGFSETEVLLSRMGNSNFIISLQKDLFYFSYFYGFLELDQNY